MDIANYSSDSRAVIKNAREVAAAFRHSEIQLEHLLIATIRHEGSQVSPILNDLGKSPAFVESVTEDFLKEQSKRGSPKENLMASPGMQESLQQAIEEKNRLYDALVEPEHILIAIFDPKSSLDPYLRDKIGISKEEIYRAIADSKSVEEIAATYQKKKGEEPGEEKGEISKTMSYCVDLTSQASAGQFDPVIGRDREIQQAIQILLRRRKNSPVLVGGPGVGKTAIVEGIAQAVVDGQVPQALKDVKVMEVDMGALVAGAKYKGEFEERFKGLISDVVKSAGKIILFIDEVHTIVKGAASGNDAGNLIKPALARGQIRLIGATTEEEYTKHLEKDKALERRFEKIKIEEPNFEDCVRIVNGVVAKYEDHHKIKYTGDAITGAVKYAIRYLSERNLPDVALDVIDEAGSVFGVKGEYARSKIPELEKRIPELKKLLKACEGKDPEKDEQPFLDLRLAYDEFSREVEMLNDYWGHRVDAGEAAS